MPAGEEQGYAADDVAAAALVFVAEVDDDLARVDGADGHHLQRVRRLRVGERVTAADGRGGWRSAVVEQADAGQVELRLTGPIRIEPMLAPGLTIAFAVTKGERPELVVQKATELGADRFVPVLTRRSVARRTGAGGVDRLRRVAREAAAQARRARVPTVEDVTPVDALVTCDGLVVADRTGEVPDALPDPPGGEWIVLIGPEGGLDETELAAFVRAPRLAVGPHVLRAETAAIAAAAALTTRRRQL